MGLEGVADDSKQSIISALYGVTGFEVGFRLPSSNRYISERAPFLPEIICYKYVSVSRVL